MINHTLETQGWVMIGIYKGFFKGIYKGAFKGSIRVPLRLKAFNLSYHNRDLQ